MPGLRVILLTVALSACSAGATTTAAPAASVPVTSAPAPSAPCVDRGQLADSADSVLVELQGVIDALKIPDTEKALSLARDAVTGLRSIADLVGPAQPEAAKDFRSEADALNSATSAFPGSASVVDQVKTEFAAALLLARTAGC